MIQIGKLGVCWKDYWDNTYGIEISYNGKLIFRIWQKKKA
jgi:hypothetical protein